jgi:NAD(P)-dependent dehydrogenase (short-subunit alcohol dehydrogenase family)
MQDFKDKVAVVTGAASGIGLALAKSFAAEGMKLVLVDIEQAALERAVAQLPAGTEVLTSVTDVSNAEQMDALAEKTFERFGTLHVLCNNAGVGGGGGATWELSTLDWQWVLGVNLYGVIHGVRVFGSKLVAQNEGYIVNTASVAGLTSNAGLGPYNVSKHGVVTFSETLFAELKMRKSAVGVSVLCPAFVQTKIHESERNRPTDLKNPPKSLSEERLAQTKQGRDLIASLVAAGQTPEAIADKVLAAMRERRFYILTHPEMSPLIEQRIKNVLGGADPTHFG